MKNIKERHIFLYSFIFISIYSLFYNAFKIIDSYPVLLSDK